MQEKEKYTKPHEVGLRGKAMHGAFWSLLQNVALQLTNFISLLVLARLLTIQDFGVAAMASIFISITQVFAESGIPEALIQKNVLDDITVSTAFWLNMGAGVLLCASTFSLAPWISSLLDEPALTQVLQALALILLLRGASGVQTALLRRNLEFKRLALMTTGARLAGMGSAVVLAFSGAGVWSLVAQQLIAGVLTCAALWKVATWRPSWSFSSNAARHLVGFGVNILGVNLLNAVGQRVDRFIVGGFLGTSALGLYNLAAELIARLTDMIVGSLSGVAFPLFSRLAADRVRLGEVVLRVIKVSSLVAVPLYLGLSATSDLALPVLFGEKWRDASPLVTILAFNGVLYAVMAFSGSLLNACGHPRVNLVVTVMQVVGNVIFISIGVQWGLAAVAFALVIRGFLLSPIHFYLVTKFASISLKRYMQAYLPSLIAGITMWVGVLGFRNLITPMPVGVEFAVTAATGFVVYYAMLRVLGQDPVKIIQALRSIKKDQPANAT